MFFPIVYSRGFVEVKCIFFNSGFVALSLFERAGKEFSICVYAGFSVKKLLPIEKGRIQFSCFGVNDNAFMGSILYTL